MSGLGRKISRAAEAAARAILFIPGIIGTAIVMTAAAYYSAPSDVSGIKNFKPKNLKDLAKNFKIPNLEQLYEQGGKHIIAEENTEAGALKYIFNRPEYGLPNLKFGNEFSLSIFVEGINAQGSKKILGCDFEQTTGLSDYLKLSPCFRINAMNAVRETDAHQILARVKDEKIRAFATL